MEEVEPAALPRRGQAVVLPRDQGEVAQQGQAVPLLLDLVAEQPQDQAQAGLLGNPLQHHQTVHLSLRQDLLQVLKDPSTVEHKEPLTEK